MLSLVPLTGWAGQISLAQITFVGVGAFAMAEVAGDAQSWLGAGNPLGLLVAAAVAVPFGVLMALPALRLQGLYLALASMAFAVMAIPLFFAQPEILGTNGRKLATPRFLGIDFDDPAQLPGAGRGRVRVARVVRRGAAAGPVRSPTARIARQPCRQCDRRREPGDTKLARVRARGRDRRVRGWAARHVPGHRGEHRLRRCCSGSRSSCCWWSAGSGTVSGALIGGISTVLLLIVQDEVSFVVFGVSVLVALTRIGPGLAALGVEPQP